MKTTHRPSSSCLLSLWSWRPEPSRPRLKPLTIKPSTSGRAAVRTWRQQTLTPSEKSSPQKNSKNKSYTSRVKKKKKFVSERTFHSVTSSFHTPPRTTPIQSHLLTAAPWRAPRCAFLSQWSLRNSSVQVEDDIAAFTVTAQTEGARLLIAVTEKSCSVTERFPALFSNVCLRVQPTVPSQRACMCVRVCLCVCKTMQDGVLEGQRGEIDL